MTGGVGTGRIVAASRRKDTRGTSAHLYDDDRDHCSFRDQPPDCHADDAVPHADYALVFARPFSSQRSSVRSL